MEGKESLHYQALPLTEIDIFHYRVKDVHVFTPSEFLWPYVHCCAYVCGLRFVFWQLTLKRSSILLQTYPKALVCTFLCKFGTCVCSGEKTSLSEKKRERESIKAR